jgi:hypothetical protein
VAAATASSADSSAEPTAIDGFAGSANPISYQQPVTLTGELVDGRTKTPVPNEPVQIKSSRSTIDGQVTDWYNGQPSFSSLRGMKVRLYYRAHGSKTWHSYRTATTGRNGSFAFSVPKNRGYSFKVVFPAQGAFQSSTSRVL